MASRTGPRLPSDSWCWKTTFLSLPLSRVQNLTVNSLENTSEPLLPAFGVIHHDQERLFFTLGGCSSYLYFLSPLSTSVSVGERPPEGLIFSNSFYARYREERYSIWLSSYMPRWWKWMLGSDEPHSVVWPRAELWLFVFMTSAGPATAAEVCLLRNKRTLSICGAWVQSVPRDEMQWIFLYGCGCY